jgi:hypothetical protein
MTSGPGGLAVPWARYRERRKRSAARAPGSPAGGIFTNSTGRQVRRRLPGRIRPITGLRRSSRRARRTSQSNSCSASSSAGSSMSCTERTAATWSITRNSFLLPCATRSAPSQLRTTLREMRRAQSHRGSNWTNDSQLSFARKPAIPPPSSGPCILVNANRPPRWARRSLASLRSAASMSSVVAHLPGFDLMYSTRQHTTLNCGKRSGVMCSGALRNSCLPASTESRLESGPALTELASSVVPAGRWA